MRISNTQIIMAGVLGTFIGGYASAQTHQDPDPELRPPARAAAARIKPETGGSSAAAASSSTATIRGSVFYNDRRTDGLFSQRREKDGTRASSAMRLASGMEPERHAA